MNDDPNFTNEKNDTQYWKKFVSDSMNLNDMTSEEKMNSGRYLLIQESNTTMVTGFTSDKISFWNYTMTSSGSSTMSFTLLKTHIILTLIAVLFFFQQKS